MAPALLDERKELEAVLASQTFQKSPGLARLLEYICTRYIEGESANLKEYNIAVEAMGRDNEFDPSMNSIVRVEVRRLREKLKKFYETEGLGHRLVISLPVGRYVPEFTRLGNEADTQSTVPAQAGPTPISSVVGRSMVSLHTTSAIGATASEAPLTPLPTRKKSHRYLIAATSILVTVALAAAVAWKNEEPRTDTFSLSHVAAADLPSSTLPAAGGIRILSGSKKPLAVDTMGNAWRGDRYYSGGEAKVIPPYLLQLTTDPALYAAYRQGNFSYRIPLPPGFYELHLRFADFLSSRLDFNPTNPPPDFMVLLNGNNLWAHRGRRLVYGIRAQLETEKIFKAVSPGKDGFLDLSFKSILNPAFVNAISIIPTPDGRSEPIRIIAQQRSLTDRYGQVWLSDRYFTDGYLTVDGVPITGASDPELFAGSRIGNFQYVIPVAESTYTLKLYFAETWFGHGGQPGGGVGSRVFRVDCNGKRLLHNFDIYAEAGARGRLLVKTFGGIKPDEDGHIVLSFIPTDDIAAVNAIEIIDESEAPTSAVARL